MTTTLSISLPESTKAFVEQQAAKHGYPSVDEYLRVVLEGLRERQAKEELDGKLLEGLRSATRRLTDDVWAELERKVRDRSPELGQE